MGQSTMIAATILGGILSSAMLSQAAPLTVRQSGSSSTTSCNSGGGYPITNTTTPPSTSGTTFSWGSYTGYPTSGTAVATIYPEYTSQYNVATGAVNFNTARGFVSRSYTNGGADSTALVTFAVPAQYSQNWCRVAFGLEAAGSYASGSLKAQLFTSLAPATASTTTWPSGNLRNQNIGAIDVVPGGEAVWQVGSGPAATSNGFFPCSLVAGQVFGGEVVPQGDQVEISWPAGQDGIKIMVY